MQKKRKSNVYAVCRGCLTRTNLSPMNKTKNLAELFSSLTTITILADQSESSQLQDMICSKCTKLLQSFDAFRKKCLKINAQLSSRYNNYQSDIKSAYTDEDALIPDIKIELDVVNVKKLNIEKDVNVKNEPNSPPDVEVDNDMEGIDTDSSDDEEVLMKRPLLTYREQLAAKKFAPRKYQPKTMKALPYQCTICNRRFLYEERLNSHLREHDGKRGVTCELCCNEYTSLSGLQKHIELMHKDSWSIRCVHCDKLFSSHSALSTHMTRHIGRSKPVCEHCGKSFFDISALKIHLPAHQTDTPFECDECGKKFKTERHCRAHSFRHKGIRNFACPSCDKTFVTRPELRQHMPVHTGDKKYNCNICQKSFRYKSQEISHMRSHTEIRY